ncbi:MAG: thioredoxin [Rhodobiaceae bacterium]|nr:thioredoxin [Rhodobiaceae bacterium]RPF97500.1 MAG: thioredoxin [Rhizobiales bacterium TMED227]|tara:strand:+ start:19262 stop:20143 length:882 start_codon:yes stop_codon:yes gene_type:complete
MDNLNQYIKDISTATFNEEVINASKDALVLVDFWAPWCGPCKQLTPTLEKLVTEYAGSVILCKLNVDENQAIAAQMGVQSIPAVFAFKDQKPVDGFMGNVTEAELRKFLEKNVGPLIDPNSDKLAQIINLKNTNNYQDALALLGEMVQEDQENADVIYEIADCYLKMNDLENAKKFISSVPEKLLQNDKIKQIKSAIDLAQSVPSDDAKIDDLISKIEENPNDHQARLDLSLYYNSIDNKDKAADLLIESIKLNKEWNDKAAQIQLLKFFEVWGFSDPVSIDKRKSLSSILFS